MTEPLSQDLVDFLARIGSVEQLEALLLLFRTADKWWSATAAAEALGGSAASVGRALDALCSRGLLDVRVAQHVLFRFGPTRAAQRDLVGRLAEAYRTHRLLVLSHVAHERDPRASIREFADAFRVRRKKETDDDR